MNQRSYNMHISSLLEMLEHRKPLTISHPVKIQQLTCSNSFIICLEPNIKFLTPTATNRVQNLLVEFLRFCSRGNIMSRRMRNHLRRIANLVIPRFLVMGFYKYVLGSKE